MRLAALAVLLFPVLAAQAVAGGDVEPARETATLPATDARVQGADLGVIPGLFTAQAVVDSSHLAMALADISVQDTATNPTSVAQAEADLVRRVQNPVAALISLPFQWNAYFDVGRGEQTLTVLNIQPVIPFKLSNDFNLITRTIVPVIDRPGYLTSDTFGIGDSTVTAFLAPRKKSKILWGIGPTLLLPTATDDKLGPRRWGLGPSAVLGAREGQWVFGCLVSNVWSIGDSSDGPDVNLMSVQPFVNYNLPDSWYLTTSPVITANWEADPENRWIVPVGGGLGKLFIMNGQPVNFKFEAYLNVQNPERGPEWAIRAQLTFLFPT